MRSKNNNPPYYGKPKEAYHWLEEIWALDKFLEPLPKKSKKTIVITAEGKVPTPKRTVRKVKPASYDSYSRYEDDSQNNQFNYFWVM